LAAFRLALDRFGGAGVCSGAGTLMARRRACSGVRGLREIGLMYAIMALAVVQIPEVYILLQICGLSAQSFWPQKTILADGSLMGLQLHHLA
jgi:hypothetical protein